MAPVAEAVSFKVSTTPPESTSNPHLKDPLLAEFLSPSFTATSYLNRTLPTPPTPTNSTPSLPPVHTSAQSTLTSLTHQQSRLLNTLSETSQTLTRLTPRLHYETQVLSSHLSSVSSALPPADRPIIPAAPPALENLQNLTLVRGKLEEVQRVFDRAMRLMGDDKIVISEVRYALVEGGVEGAREVFEGWQGVGKVFEGTVEEARMKGVMEEVEKLLAEEEERVKGREKRKEEKRGGSAAGSRVTSPDTTGGGKGMYGLIGGWGLGRR